jgi:hypothetical protein
MEVIVFSHSHSGGQYFWRSILGDTLAFLSAQEYFFSYNFDASFFALFCFYDQRHPK